MKKQLFKLFMFSLLIGGIITACSTESSETEENTTESSAEKVQTAPLKTRPDAPAIGSITVFQTSQEDRTGTILSKEIYDENSLKTTFIGYDYYGSGEETDRTTYEYDDKGHLVKMQSESDGQVTLHNYTYDDLGNELSASWSRPNGQGASEENVYNEHGHIIETKYFTSDGSYDFSRVTEFEYDAVEMVISEKRWEKYTDGSPDLMMYHMSYTYDDNGNPASKANHKDDGSVYSKEVYTYDGNSLLISVTEYEGDEIVGVENSVYNEYGEVIEDRTYSGPDVLNYTNTYEYDEFGRMIRMDYVHEDGENWGERTEYTEPEE